MTPEQFEQFNKSVQDSIKGAIETTVNGKIRRLDEKIDAYIKEDNEWKERANPTIELGNNIRGFSKVMLYILGVAAAVFGIIKYFNK